MFKDFWDRYPKRFYNMGICENTLISVTAGLSSQGYHPFVHTICPFLTERSIEQIKLDMCYNNFAGNIVTCGATFDYAWDGATHHAYTDLAVLRMLPNMEVLHLGSKREVDALIRTQYNNSRPTYFRLSDHPHAIETNLEFGKGTLLKNEGAPVTVMTAGPILGNVMEACRDLPVNLVYFHTLKPIDKALIERFRDTEILVVHDAYGLHEAIAEVPALRMHYHGLPDAFCGWYGTVHDIRKRIGLDPAGIRAAAQALLARHSPRGPTLGAHRQRALSSAHGNAHPAARAGALSDRAMFFASRLSLVTGGSGFIGTHLAKALLDQGGRVRLAVHQRAPVVTDPRVETVRGDLTRQEDCLAAMQGVDLVFHAAGAVSGTGVAADNAMAGIAKNLNLTAQVLQAAWTSGVERILIFSSSTVYPPADHPSGRRKQPEAAPHPSYLGYGRMRRYFEHLAEFVASRSDVKVAVVRPTAVYGPHDDFDPTTSHVIPALVRKAVAKLDPFEVWGTGDEVRDFLHVEDLARVACWRWRSTQHAIRSIWATALP